MLSNELLLSKGFKLNEYPQGKHYEFVTNNNDLIQKILDKDYFGNEETLILQLKEDFSNIVLCVDTNVWDINEQDLTRYLDSINN